jgi:hypothetical protein
VKTLRSRVDRPITASAEEAPFASSVFEDYDQ